MATQAEIYRKVAVALVEALSVDEDAIKPEATLQGDLGAESIDLLDIVFRLEREFGIEISSDELFPEPIFQGNSGFTEGGRLTEICLAELRARLPFADFRKLEQDPSVSELRDLFTVEMLNHFIASKLGAGVHGETAGEQARHL